MAKLRWATLLGDGITAFSKDWKNYTVWALALLTLPYVLLYFLPNTQITLGIIGVFLLVASLKFSAGVLVIGGRTLKKKKTSVKQFKKELMQKFLPYAGTSLLVGLIAFAIMLVFFLASSWVSAYLGVEGTALAILLLLAGVIVTVLVTIKYLFAGIIAVLGKEKYVGALAASKKLVNKHYWKTLWWAIGYFFVITIPVALLDSLINAALAMTPTTIAIGLTITGLLQSILFIPLTLTFASCYYKL